MLLEATAKLSWYSWLSNLSFNTVHCTEGFLSQIAALSPADINYDETLSTLRYGEQD